MATLKQMLVYAGTKKIPNFLSDEQIQTILISLNKYPYHPGNWGRWCKSRDRLLILMGLWLGLRPKEVCHLKKIDIDFENMRIKIRGENNKQKADRFLFLTERLKKEIVNYMMFSQLINIQSEYLFPSRQNEKYSPRTLKGKFRNILKLAGIWDIDYITEHGQKRPNYRFYSLRHTFGSKIYNKSKNVFFVANQLGHRKLESSNVYIHTDTDNEEYERKILKEIC